MAIVSITEMARALMGTLLLVGFNPRGASLLDDSVDGFWKSFQAAVLLAPIYALMLWLARYSGQAEANNPAVWAIEAVAYIGGWLLWPVIVAEFTRIFAPKAEARAYIVACNWSEVWIIMVRFPLLALAVGGLMDRAGYGALSVAAVGVVFFYRLQIARFVLPTAVKSAIGVAFADLMVGLIWRACVEVALRPWTGSSPL